MLNKELQHKPVMCEEVLSILNPSDGCVYLDGTLGAGGHSRKILESADCSVVGIDKDPTAIELCRDLEKQYGNKFLSINGSFGNLSQHLNSIGINKIDGILLDLGTSSMQLGTPERGFSFQFDAPLDMRMTQTGERAYDIINSLSEDSLANIIFYFGEERRSRKIAKAIVNKRKIKKIKTTFDLNEIILSVKKANNKKIHPATKTFQALRIYINNELKDLYEALISIEKVLSEKGRLVVISFHSLEDRIVKNFIKENSIPLRKYDPKNFVPTPVKNSPIRSAKIKPKTKSNTVPSQKAPTPIFRVSGAKTPAPRPTHISGR